MISIEGTILDIIFRNEENSYTIAVLESEGEKVTIVGYLPFVNPDENIRVSGDFTYHNKYGEQFKVENMEILVPSSLKGIERYLSSGLIPYVGPKTAKKMVEKFGLETLDIIQYKPERLLEIEGIGEKKLEKILDAFEEQDEIRNIMVFLQQYGITANYSMKIYRKYGQDTIAKIKENPYRLAEDVYGIGFKTADKIAKNMGVEFDSPYRIEGGIMYLLNRSMNEGHTFLPKEELLKKAAGILELSTEDIEFCLSDLMIKDKVFMAKLGEDTIIYPILLHRSENMVAQKLAELSLASIDDLDVDVEKRIEEIEEEDNIVFGKKQREAIKAATENGLLVITGGPGTGKTTTINSIIKIFEEEGKKVLLAAPTGRAAKRMSETSNKEAKTIHRLLEYSFMEEDGIPFGMNEENPLETDLLIVDEASMMDILLMNSLLKAINPGTRLILVGDIDQLPAVGPGNVLRDIIASEKIKVIILDEIFRQAEESMIVVNAHRINKGESPFLNLKGKDFYFIRETDPVKIRETIEDLCKFRLPNFYKLDPIEDIQVLAPMKKGDAGVIMLNEGLQKVLNKENVLKKEKKVGNTTYRVGDKVMQIKNNYSIEWEVRGEDDILIEKDEGIYNGDLGFIRDIDHEGNYMTIVFDGEKEVEYSFDQLDELQLSYATTVHKSQGSEFPVLVMPIAWGPPMLLTRNLLYTAITRAKELVVLVGDDRYLNMMIRNNRITKRYSSLDTKLKALIEQYELLEG